MSIKLKKQFENFHTAIALTTHNGLQEKRTKLQEDIENALPSKLREEDMAEINKGDLRFIDQGSWAFGVKTSIHPNKDGSGDQTFDRDVAAIIPLDKDKEENKDSRKIKKIIRDILKIENIRTPLIKDPCVTVNYSKEGNEIYHLDFPIYAKDSCGQLWLARGKEFSENYEWQEADPEGLNDYFKNHFADEIGNQKRRIVRYIKKWKQNKYTTPGNDVPPSIGLTILACDNFHQYSEGDDLQCLHKTLQNILSKFSLTYDFDGNITKVNISCNLPITPYSDIFYKMRGSADHLIKFYKRFEEFANNIENAFNAEHEHEAANYVVKSLGEEFEVPDKEPKKDTSALKREDRFA